MTQANCKTCPKTVPYTWLYNRTFAALEKHGNKSLSVAAPMAIMVKEAQASPTFQRYDSLFKANLQLLFEETGMGETLLADTLGLGKPVSAPPIPKFRYESSWRESARSVCQKGSFTANQETLAACSWGLGQKGGWIYLVDSHKPIEWETLRAFIFDVDAQVLQVVQDIDMLLRDSHNDIALAGTRYNAGPGAHLVTSYGKALSGIYNGVTRMLHEGGYKLCLD